VEKVLPKILSVSYIFLPVFIQGRRFKIGSNKEIFSFNLMVYFLSVQKFYSNRKKYFLLI